MGTVGAATPLHLLNREALCKEPNSRRPSSYISTLDFWGLRQASRSQVPPLEGGRVLLMAPTLKGLRGITAAILAQATVAPLSAFSTLEADAAAGTALGLSGGSQAAALGQV